ncbi:ubiquinol oxidase subunit II [Salinisphaera aquimarina]|uniref:Ubiquinol oxidase subunit 2 n=1 Tax=Salinisphaera aquimarina TaxID=2094031 RepID=A0ABV7ENF7_9GAMM
MPGNNLRRARGVFMLVLGVGLPLLLSGCGVDDWINTFHLDSLVTFFTAGPVAAYERNLMLFVFTVMLFVLVPVVGFTLWFAWHYRASNRNNTYTPNWHHSGLLEIFLWGGPVVIVLILATLTWFTTHDLDPYKPLESEHPTIEVQAIAMDWKWLFIYPEYNVAVVNEIAMPVDVPVRFHLTSASVMNAFMIPRLGSQIYAMSGMETKLHLMADQKGTFFGKNYQYSGDGFAHMNFEAHSVTQDEFDQWIAKAKASGRTLDTAAYKKLVKPSEDDSVSYYSSVRPDLFQHVIDEFNSANGNAHHTSHRGSASH